ncbi:MAG: efflux RND transporter permease subunit [Oscillospiraceae bacterium]|nr:efflux RND transporter permease subunit [Oscillospiraceae bacterium]
MARLSVRKPFTVLVAVIVVIALGVVSMLNMTTDLLPTMSLPYLVVLTTYPGASPEKVESEVTLPMEQALGTVKNVQTVSSVSAENYGYVQLEFAAGTNMDSAMVNVSSAVNQVAASLPELVGTPSILEISMDMIATMYIAVSRAGNDIYELSDYVDKEIIPYFQRQNGVARVTAVGLVEQSIHVELNADKIDALNDRILELADSKLAEARLQLDEAREQVDAGQAALEAQQRQFGQTLATTVFDQLDGPSADLTARLSTVLSELSGTLGTVENRLRSGGGTAGGSGEFDAAIRELNAAWDALNVEPEAAQSALETAGDAIDTLNKILEAQRVAGDVTALRNDLLRAEAAWAAAGEALRAGDWATLETTMRVMQEAFSSAAEHLDDSAETLVESREDFLTLADELSSLRSDLDTVRRGLTDANGVGHAFTHLTTALGYLGSLGARLFAVANELTRLDLGGELSGYTELLRARINDLNARTGEIPGLLGSLEALVAGLTQGQLDAALAFVAATQQLSQARTQLQSAEVQYEQARAQARASANVDSLVDASTLSKLIYAQNFAMPAGYVDDENDKSWLLRVGDEYGSEDDLSGALLAEIEGLGSIRLSDVADITVIDNAAESYARLNDTTGVMLCVYKGSTAGTNAVSRACLQAMDELEARDPELKLVRLLDQGKYITLIVNSILQSMSLGALLAVVILALFLRDVKPTLVVAISIPLSVLFALVLMYFTGLSLNMMTLSGLALGIGMLVDNSIVVLENVVRLRARGLAAPRAAVQGTKQVAGAIVASTLTTISVFFPMVFTSGTVRDLLVPLSLSVSYCLIASLLVAMTVIPASASTLLARSEPKPSRVMERVQARYGRVLRWCLAHKAAPLIAAGLLLAFCLWRLLAIGIVILPEMNSDSVNVTVSMPEGIERAEAYALGDEIVRRLMTLEGIEDVGVMDTASVISSVGISGGGSGNSSFGDFMGYVTVPEGTRASKIRRLCREAEALCADLPCTVSADTASMMDFSSMTESGLSIQIYGRDPDRMSEIAGQVAELVRSTEGFTDVSDGGGDESATLHLVIDKDKAMEYGLTVAQIYMEIAARLTTEVTSTVITSDGMDMTVRVSNSINALTRENLLDMEFTPVSYATAASSASAGSSSGGMDMAAMMEAFGMSAGDAAEAPAEEAGTEDEAEPEPAAETHVLREFAWLEETASASSIGRKDLTRYVTVSAAVLPGYNVSVLARNLAEPLDELRQTLPYGYSIELGGESEQVSSMVSQMLQLGGLGLLFIYLIMVAQFQSLLSPFIILFTVPLAFTGGMLALLVAGRQLSMLDIMGFLILMGTVVNNGIVFVDYTNQLRLGGLEKRDALVATGQTRMRPILMTTLTTILAMASLIFGDDMGSQMGGGMAIVITGGLLYATAMTLFIIPTLYDLFYRKQPQLIDTGDDLDELPDDAAEFLESLRRERENSEEL